MMKLTTHTYNIAEQLRTPEEMALYLDACIEESDGNAAFIAKTLGDIARGQEITQAAKQSAVFVSCNGDLTTSEFLAILLLTTPATLQARAQAQVQCSQGGFLFSGRALK